MLTKQYGRPAAGALLRPAIAAALFGLCFAIPAQAGEVRLASAPFGPPVGGSSFSLRWDAAGRFGVFVSSAGNLFPGQNTVGLQIFLFDRRDQSVRLVSHLPGNPVAGTNGLNPLIDPGAQISADGKWGVYNSTATDLVAGQQDGNRGTDVFLWSREQDANFLVSHRADSDVAAGRASSAASATSSAISDDGRFVAYASRAQDLVAGQLANAFEQIYQFDRASGVNRLVSHSSADPLQSGNHHSRYLAEGRGRVVSGDGRWVVFASGATDLIEGLEDTNLNHSDVFLWDRDADAGRSLRLLSRRAGAPLTTVTLGGDGPQISADGSAVAFISHSNDLEGITSDGNGLADVFRYDRLADRVELVSHDSQTSTRTGNDTAFHPSITADGRQIAFQSRATNHVFAQVDNNTALDVFLWQKNGPIRLISHQPGFPRHTGNAPSTEPIVAADGSGVAFDSASSNLAVGVGDFNGAKDVFWRPLAGSSAILVSHVPNGTRPGDLSSSLSDVALGGDLIGFNSSAPNLVAEPSNAGVDVFFHLP